MLSRLITLKNSISQSASKHWLLQRITALLLIPLTFKLIVFLSLCTTAPYQQTVDWLKSPLNTLIMELWVLVAFYHAALGLQVVVEDYIARQPLQAALIKITNLGLLFLTVITLFFIFKTF